MSSTKAELVQKTLERFKNVEKNLSVKPWFKKEGWLVSVHPFPEQSPDGITFHVFKKHWFNEGRGGIHIESYLSLDTKKQKKTYLTLHVLHHPLIPGTKIKREKISRPFVDEIYAEVKSWEGYKFRAGKYGVQPFTMNLNGQSDDFESELESEVERLCRKLGPALDRAIKAALKS
ncbi:MAG: hypothetical protein ACXVBE_05375 [Bdellovibrionota bacterium]